MMYKVVAATIIIQDQMPGNHDKVFTLSIAKWFG